MPRHRGECEARSSLPNSILVKTSGRCIETELSATGQSPCRARCIIGLVAAVLRSWKTTDMARTCAAATSSRLAYRQRPPQLRQLAMLAAIRGALVAGQQLGRSRPHSITPRRRAVGAAPDCTDVGRRPPRQINHDSLSTQWLTACYQEAGAERGNNGPMQFITAIQRNRH